MIPRLRKLYASLPRITGTAYATMIQQFNVVYKLWKMYPKGHKDAYAAALHNSLPCREPF
ncbi:hypothetical protein GCM10023310_71560 [Paenibacillus vulneris]|uniref:Transposase n=1 Tax=Paenibacillus vulneris TaxID=1133364 RepID=A0ABW3UV68_9BACL|nr:MULTISPECIES: hypothetical protein [unclassified Paenibacillus]MBE1445593.1 hypothetical protein [Paenibacillus sp. OAS669]